MNTLIIIGVTLFVLILIVFIWKKMFGKKKTPVETKDNTAKAKDKELEATTTNKLKILIWRSMSDSLVAQVGNPILAEEKKDSNNNLLVIQEEANFKEDFGFQPDRIYEIMNFSLKMQNKSKSEKAEILRKEIKKQESLLLEIESDIEKNANYNHPDEELKLRQLKVFYDSLKRETYGNYMRLGKGGIRQFEFIVIDGVLYPYYFGSKWHRVYPDLQVKKKIFNHENTVFRTETQALFKSAINWITVITLVLGLIMMGLGAGLISYGYKTNSDVTLKANQGAISCTNTLATINANYGSAVSDYLEYKKFEIQNIKKTENPNNNIPQFGDIIVDPSKITK